MTRPMAGRVTPGAGACSRVGERSEGSSFFALLVSEIRGFDLGDDAELLEELSSKRDASPDALEGDDWLLLGVLRHRAASREREGSSDPDAITCFSRASAMGHRPALAHFLRGHALLLLGRHAEADEAFTAAAQQEGDDACPPAELVHARGKVARERSDQNRALSLFVEGLEIDPASTSRWMDTARLLLELERFDEARDALRRALVVDPENVDAAYESAALAGRQRDAATATEALGRAIELDGESRAWARDDPRFDAVRDDPDFAAVLASPPAADLRWLDEGPSWLKALREEVTSDGLELQWLSADTSEKLAAEISRSYEAAPPGVMYSEVTLARARECLHGKRPVAYGPTSTTLDRKSERSIVWLDRERPESLWLALSRHVPPFLWLPLGTSAHDVRASLAEGYARPAWQKVEMPGVSRGFLGYRLRFGIPDPHTGAVEPANARELDRYFMVNPFVEAVHWGSAYDDDPWPEEIPPQPGELLKLSARQRRVAEQAPGHVWSITRRTRHSRSYLSIELHHRDVFIAEVRYRPAREPTVIARLNEDLGCDYPTDMPVDAVAALLGLQFEQSADLQARLDATADAEEIAGLLLVLSALRHSDLSMTRVYRRYMDHPESVVRTTLCNIFVAHNHESLLEEMCIVEPDDEIRAQIESVLDEGIGVVQYDPYTDYDESDIDFGDDQELEVEVEEEQT